MNSSRFTLVDVFGTGGFTGNPLAVVHDAGHLDDTRMQAIARWFNLSETVFLVEPRVASADLRLRIFALHAELPWAGHPLLGAVHAWLGAGGQPRKHNGVHAECSAGVSVVTGSLGRLSFAAPEPRRIRGLTDEERASVFEVLGSDGHGIIDAAWVDNGPDWLCLLFDSVDRMIGLDVRQLPAGILHLGLAGLRNAGELPAIETRAFHCDARGQIVEDPVTGSFNAALAAWLIPRGRLPSSYRAAQGQCVGRRGRIDVDGRGDRILLTGATRTIASGTIDLDQP